MKENIEKKVDTIKLIKDVEGALKKHNDITIGPIMGKGYMEEVGGVLKSNFGKNYGFMIDKEKNEFYIRLYPKPKLIKPCLKK